MMVDRIRKILKCIPLILFLVLLAVLACYNAKTNNEFWKASAVNCVTIGTGIIVSYILVQRKSDQRKQRDIILDLVRSFYAQVTDESSYDFTGQEVSEILMRKRDFSNKIDILDKYKERFGISQDIEFVKAKYNEYDLVIGDHITDINALINAKDRLHRPLILISEKLFDIELNLYN